MPNNKILAAILAATEQRESIALVTVTHGSGAWAGLAGRHMVVWADTTRPELADFDAGPFGDSISTAARAALHAGQHRQVRYNDTAGELTIFVEVLAQPPHLIIMGAGHIAAPLASIAKICDFQVTVLDDRREYATPARFPTADRVIAGPFRAELRRLRGGRTTFDAQTYLVLVTRGHQYDVECLLETLEDPVAYTGMIGSQRRIRAVYELLEREQGILPERFAHVYAPVGLDIGAQTPAEIAVSIMGEIINLRRGGKAITLSQQIRQEQAARRTQVRHSAA